MAALGGLKFRAYGYHDHWLQYLPTSVDAPGCHDAARFDRACQQCSGAGWVRPCSRR